MCDIWRARRARLILLAGTAAVIPFLLAATASATEPKRVLLVHSFGRAAPIPALSLSFESELTAKMDGPVDLDEVSVDMARYADPEMQEAIAEYLEKHMAKWRPDLVVPMAAPAAMFVAKYRERLFPGTPALYIGTDPRNLPPGALEQNATAVEQALDIPGLFEDILQVAPATKNIAVVVGATPLEQRWQRAFQKASEPLAGRIKFTYFNDLSFKEMQERVATLPPNSYIFYFMLLRDATGVTYSTDDALRRLSAVANAPMNSIFAHQLGTGIVGGRLYPTELVGKEAGDVAVRILHGEPASSFPPKLIDRLPPRYDWRALKRWKIDEKLLPPGSTILFREPTVWERYQTWIISGFSLCILQGLLIAGLVASLISRRKAESSLEESEKRFQTTADASPVMMWMTGEDELCTYVNKAWLEFTGRRLEQDLGEGWSESIHPDDLGKTLQTYGSAFDARERFAMQYRLKRRDGEYRWITDQGVPRYGPRGNFRGYVGACVDITDLLDKDRALREVEDRVALATEVAHLAVWELDTVTYDLWISDNGRKLFGFESEGPISYATYQDRVHPEDRARRASTIKQAIETQSGYSLEYRFLLPDGSVRWIGGRGRCVSDKDGRLTRLVGVTMDTTELKQAQQLFQLATEASPSGVALADATGRIVLVNAHVEELFGYGRDELIGKSIEILVRERFALYAPADREEFFAELQRGATGSGRELLAVRRDGSEFPVEISLNPIQTPQGILILASIVDISARKLAEEEAQRRREEIDLLSRVSLLGEMTASIAHEVNQPLSGIISNAGAGERFIDRGNVNLEQLREILVDIGADGRRAYNVMQNIRNTVKRGGAIRERLSINDVVTHVAHLIQPDAAAHSCHLKISLADRLPAVDGDPIQIQQVLVNLIGNAFDSMRETALENRKVEVSTKRNGDETVELSVRDYGVGIDEGVRSRIFEQFFTTKEDGLGMGLAIVRSIIQAHEGSIVVENAPGGGACFSVTMPVSNGTAP